MATESRPTEEPPPIEVRMWTPPASVGTLMTCEKLTSAAVFSPAAKLQSEAFPVHQQRNGKTIVLGLLRTSPTHNPHRSRYALHLLTPL